jgi:hypothetical protein
MRHLSRFGTEGFHGFFQKRLVLSQQKTRWQHAAFGTAS